MAQHTVEDSFIFHSEEGEKHSFFFFLIVILTTMWLCLEFCSCGALRLGTIRYVYLLFFVGLDYVVKLYFNDGNL